MTDTTKFQKGSGCYTCRDCGKRTRETGGGESNLRLCKQCDEAAMSDAASQQAAESEDSQ